MPEFPRSLICTTYLYSTSLQWGQFQLSVLNISVQVWGNPSADLSQTWIDWFLPSQRTHDKNNCRNEERNFPINPGSVSGHRMGQRGPTNMKIPQIKTSQMLPQTESVWTGNFEHAHLIWWAEAKVSHTIAEGGFYIGVSLTTNGVAKMHVHIFRVCSWYCRWRGGRYMEYCI